LCYRNSGGSSIKAGEAGFLPTEKRVHITYRGSAMTRRFAIMPSLLILFFFLGCFLTPSKGFLWAFVPDDLGFVISGQEGSGRTAPSGKTFTNSIGMKFVLIPAGAFMMGSPSSEPNRDSDETQHRVTLTKPYYMQTTEVTQGQWKAVMGTMTMTIARGCLFPTHHQVETSKNPSYFNSCGDDCPVENVSWNDCQLFIQKLNKKEGTNEYRLPTEAEWEYACREGTTTPFNTGNCLSTHNGNYNGNYPYVGCSKGQYRMGPLPVASFSPNAWGLYDMHGNVSEWCAGWYGEYLNKAVTNPEGPVSGTYRVLRGGSWGIDENGCRSANRYRPTPGVKSNTYGFRLARDLYVQN